MSDTIGYAFGRLFAVFEHLHGRTQSYAWPPTFYNQAQTQTRLFFAGRFRILQNTIYAKLPDNHVDYFDRMICKIVNDLPAELPPRLSIKDQGPFELGRSHQLSELKKF